MKSGGSDNPRFRIASFPGVDNPNPYFRLFYQALGRHSVDVVPGGEPSREWLLAHRPLVDAIHLHWPEKIWRSHQFAVVKEAARRGVRGAWRFLDALSPLRQAAGMRELGRLLMAANRCGIRVIWTYHNSEPHEGASWFARRGYSMVAASADLIICHTHSAREECLRELGPSCPVIVMPMGIYEGHYPRPRPRAITLARFELSPGVPVLLSVGAIRPYKGFDIGCRAALKLGGEVQYVVSASPGNHRSASELRGMAEGHHWIKFLDGPLTDQEYADLSAACDAIILPYRKITGSSALMSALTFHRGVVASDLPFFRETLADEPDAGGLATPADPDALAGAIDRYLRDVSPDRRTAAAERLSRRHRWTDTVTPVADLIGAWMDNSSRRATI
jgi:beta-1,4-mannosyltransferase